MRKTMLKYGNKITARPLPDSNTLLSNIHSRIETFRQLRVLDSLETLLIIPLEIWRIEKIKKWEEYHYYSQVNFLNYHLRSLKAAEGQSSEVISLIQEYESQIAKLDKLKPSQEESNLLRGLILYVKELNLQTEKLIHAFSMMDLTST